MNPILRNVLAVVAGIVLGGVANLAVLQVGMSLAPMPEGIDPMDPLSIKQNLDRFSLANFLVPLFAHAIGTFAGALIAATIAGTRKMQMALLVGVFFLSSGIQMIVQVGGPLWFKIADIALAYIPMAWLGGTIGSKKRG